MNSSLCCDPPFGLRPSSFPASSGPCGTGCLPPAGISGTTLDGIVIWLDQSASQLGGSAATADALGNIKALTLSIGNTTIKGAGTSGTFLGYQGGVLGFYTVISSVLSVAGTLNQVLVNGAIAPASGALVLSLPTSIVNVNSHTSQAATNLTLNTGTFGNVLTLFDATGGAEFKGALQVDSSFSTAGNVALGQVGASTTIALKVNNTETGTGSFTPIGIYSTATLNAGVNNQNLVGVWNNPTLNAGAFTGVSYYGLDAGTVTLGTGALLNAYQVYVNQAPTATNAWGVYQAGTDKNLLTGSLTLANLSTAGVVLNSAAGLLSTSVGTNGQVLTITGGAVVWGSSTAAAGGSNTQLQYNNSGPLGGTSGLTWNSGSGLLNNTQTNTAQVGLITAQNSSTGTAAGAFMQVSNSASGLFLGISSTLFSGSFLSGGPTGQSAAIYTTNAVPLVLGTNNAANLTIASGGAVTIPGNVTVGSTSGGDALIGTANSGTNNLSFSFVNTGGTSFIGLENSTGGHYITGSAAYDMVVRSANRINFATGGGNSVLILDSSQNAVFAKGVSFGITTAFPTGSIGVSAGGGITMVGKTGSVNDLTLTNGAGNGVMAVPTGTLNASFQGALTTASTLTVTSGNLVVSSGVISSNTGSFAAPVGYINVPQNSQSAAYGLVLGDQGGHIYHPSADTTARTWTIPANASVAYPIGTALTFVNDTSAGVVTIAITTDTLVLAGAGTTGSRTLAASGVATAMKMTATRWMISGTGLT